MPTKTDRPIQRKVWTPPTITCLAARPEVTAYSGDDTGPWALRSSR